MDSQLKRGFLNICILQLLREERYGYDVIKIMQTFFPETEESTLYAILRRLNKEGLTELRLSNDSNGPVRKYYSLTKNGVEKLDDYIESLKEIEDIFVKIGIL